VGWEALYAEGRQAHASGSQRGAKAERRRWMRTVDGLRSWYRNEMPRSQVLIIRTVWKIYSRERNAPPINRIMPSAIVGTPGKAVST
jgi:hypothetical protein